MLARGSVVAVVDPELNAWEKKGCVAGCEDETVGCAIGSAGGEGDGEGVGDGGAVLHVGAVLACEEAPAECPSPA